MTAEEEENPELADMSRRFWVSLGLTAPLLLIAMARDAARHAARRWRWLPWAELLLATPVVLWGGRPFFERGWTSVVNRSTNMFTLIAMGTGVAYLFSLVATVMPEIFPASPCARWGARLPIYFEASAAIVTLVLLGQVLELRARSRTGAAIRASAESDSEDGAGDSRRAGSGYPAGRGEGGRPAAGTAGRKDSRGWDGGGRIELRWTSRW